jgi:hypothetical protein
MSLEIVRQVNRDHPALLQTNINATCYQFVVLVIAALRAKGHLAYHVCKSPGEGQYTPPGFTPRTVTGLDNNPYPCSGVSHDALWCDGVQVDTIGRGNDSPDPIFNPDGSRMTGDPAWNSIPSQFWRPNNPPLKDGATIPPGPPTPPTPPAAPYIPSYGELGDDAFFRAQIGVPLQADMLAAGQQLNDGSSVWFSRTTYEILTEALKAGKMIDTAPIVKKYRNQWRVLLGLPPL